MRNLKKENKIRIGTRGSRLALVQTDLVLQSLKKKTPDLKFEIQVIKTQGDRMIGALEEIGGQGVFVKEIEEALLREEIDLAVHSLKDLPTEQPPGLEIGIFLSRGDARDVLVCGTGTHATPPMRQTEMSVLQGLPSGAKVGTGSPRRRAQLFALRSDLRIEDIRGNVDTRLRKLFEGKYEAIILAAAGLERLGLLDREKSQIKDLKMQVDYFPIEVMLPAVGQGVLAIEVRMGDNRMMDVLKPLDDPPTRLSARAEISFLKELGGGCRVPIAAFARLNGESLLLEGLVASQDGRRMVREKITGSSQEPERAGRDLAERLRQAGGEVILNELEEISTGAKGFSNSP